MTERVELNCRTADVGGGLDPLKALLTLQSLRGKQHFIFLIHGYNNPVKDASASYAKFQNLQSAAVVDGLDWTFGATLVEVYWPGDAAWGLASALFYPKALPLADQTALLLGQLLDDLGAFNTGGISVDLVCHSMGNRVALQMAAALTNRKQVHLRRVVHMAAAVPVSKLEDQSNSLNQGFVFEAGLAEALSFYSADDTVLAYAFPVGESADASADGFMPVALGHRFWSGGTGFNTLKQLDAAPANHGDYWSGGQVQATEGTFLDLTMARQQVADSRMTPKASSAPAIEAANRSINARLTGSDLFAADHPGG